MGGISLAVVADEINLPRLAELTKLAIKYDGHIRINRLYHGGRIPGYVNRFGQAMHTVFDELLAAPKAMWPNFILESTYPLWEGPQNCHACGRWFLVFDPDGTIRSCNADMSTKIGSIYTHYKMADFKFTHRWSSKNLSECQDCEWANGGWCQGGCPFSRKLTWGTYGKATPFCKVYKELFPRLKELTDKWKQQRGSE
jgi:radical SAM protein with 4Fe4S-binding SPASM domain